MTDWPKDAPRRASYQGHTPDSDQEEAAALFECRYGRPPGHVFEVPGALYVGPIPTEGSASFPAEREVV